MRDTECFDILFSMRTYLVARAVQQLKPTAAILAHAAGATGATKLNLKLNVIINVRIFFGGKYVLTRKCGRRAS